MIFNVNSHCFCREREKYQQRLSKRCHEAVQNHAYKFGMFINNSI